LSPKLTKYITIDQEFFLILHKFLNSKNMYLPLESKKKLLCC
jgi:hypothetical protein